LFVLATEVEITWWLAEQAITQLGRNVDRDLGPWTAAQARNRSLKDKFSVRFELNSVDDVLTALEGSSGVKILILDACRDNPLATRLTQRASLRSLGNLRGLARIGTVRGMVIAYAAQPNQMALDGNVDHSPVTAALLKYIDQPGMEIGIVFRRVTGDVNKATGGRQTPELSLSLFGDFYLNPRPTDEQAWAKIRNADSTDVFDEFLHDYPRSVLAKDAQMRIAAIKEVHLKAEQAGKERLAAAVQDRARRALSRRSYWTRFPRAKSASVITSGQVMIRTCHRVVYPPIFSMA
jgi:hypothetical protein